MDRQFILKWGSLLIGFTLLSAVFWGPRTYWGLLGLIPIGYALSDTCPYLSGLKYYILNRRDKK